MSADPWTIAAAIWPGCFLPHERDRQAELGRGDWPRVAVAWKPELLQRYALQDGHIMRLRVLELRPSLAWLYVDPVVMLHAAGGRGTVRVQDRLVAEAGRLRLQYWSRSLRQGPIAVQLRPIRRVGARGDIAPDLGAVLRLIREGAIPYPQAGSRVDVLLRRHQQREERIAASPAGQAELFGRSL